MDTLDVFKLAKQVSEDSLSGSMSKELLLKENVLYGASETIGRFTRLKPNGEFDPELITGPESPHIPTAADKKYLLEIMNQVRAPGQYANWITPPKQGINRQPTDFEYVKFV